MRMYRLSVVDDQREVVSVTDDVHRALSNADTLITAMPGNYPHETGFTFSHADAVRRLHEKKVLIVQRPDGSIVSLEVEDID